MTVRVEVTGGAYAGSIFEGPLRDAPVTVLIPEGIMSARTIEAAERMRSAIGTALETANLVAISSTCWQIIAQKVEP